MSKIANKWNWVVEEQKKANAEAKRRYVEGMANAKEQREKNQAFGRKIRSIGFTLTLVLTVPVLLSAFLGIPGMIIGGIIAVVAIAGLFK